MGYGQDSNFDKQMIMKFVLTAFHGSQVKDVENENGDLERCVCIPIDRNGLRVGSTGKVSCYAFIVPCRNANRFGWTFYAKQKLSNGFVAKMKSLGYDSPYLGNLRPSNYISYGKSYDTAYKADKKVKISDYEDD